MSFSAIVALVVMGFSFIDEADAGVSDNVSGYAWSDNIGWIGFNLGISGMSVLVGV